MWSGDYARAMIHSRMDFHSPALGMGTSAVVLYPQQTDGQIGMAGGIDLDENGEPRVPVLYLLHGLSDDCTGWTRRTSIERYASAKGICVVMPEVRRSFYADEVLGEKYWTYVSEELPALINQTFRVSTAREDTFVAGLSMGGFGAMKLALNQPERFAAAGSFSGALAVAQRDYTEFGHAMPARIWGQGLTPEAGSVYEPFFEGVEQGAFPAIDDVNALARAAEPGSLPRLWIGCGTEDFLLEETRTFVRTLEERGHAHEVTYTPGAHEWAVWDEYVRRFLDWI